MTIIFLTVVVAIQFFQNLELAYQLVKKDEEIAKLKGPYDVS